MADMRAWLSNTVTYTVELSTANTRADGAAFLRLARTLELSPKFTPYTFDHVVTALDDLRAGRASGSLVITMP